MGFVFVTTPGLEAALLAEMGPAAGRRVQTLAPGLLHCPQLEASPAATDFVFARQVLPRAHLVRADSVSGLASGALAYLVDRLADTHGAIRLDTFVCDEPVEPGIPGGLLRRARLCAEALLEQLKGSARSVWRRFAPPADGATLPAAHGVHVQLLLADASCLVVSAASAVELPAGGLWPAPFLAGRAAVADDWDAPSSAFRKLEEAFAWMERAVEPGQRCVDLGAAPGSWSHVALRHGAHVVAVDRAALAPAVARHPRLRHARRDAFSFVPDGPPADWLLCDIIAAPAKSLALLGKWASARWCRQLVLHLKFKGRANYGILSEVAPLLAAEGFGTWRIKHLFYDRNEVTVMAARDEPKRGPAPDSLPR